MDPSGLVLHVESIEQYSVHLIRRATTPIRKNKLTICYRIEKLEH